jgi:hypothetical protein
MFEQTKSAQVLQNSKLNLHQRDIISILGRGDQSKSTRRANSKSINSKKGISQQRRPS